MLAHPAARLWLSPLFNGVFRQQFNSLVKENLRTAARFREGTNVVVIDPEVLDVFPDGRSVNEALRALADVIRRGRERKSA